MSPMIPASIKCFFWSQTCGVVLCLIDLFLIGDTLYLNTIRDHKAETVEMVGLALDDYQLTLEHSRKAWLPGVLNRDFRYGALLKTALTVFKTNGQNITVSKVKLTEEENRFQGMNNEMLASPSSRRKKSKKSENIQTLQISGSISPSKNPEPFSQLNEVIAQIKTETGCQFSLERANEMRDSDQTMQDNQPLSFEIQLIPATQKSCIQKFVQSGGKL